MGRLLRRGWLVSAPPPGSSSSPSPCQFSDALSCHEKLRHRRGLLRPWQLPGGHLRRRAHPLQHRRPVRPPEPPRPVPRPLRPVLRRVRLLRKRDRVLRRGLPERPLRGPVADDHDHDRAADPDPRLRVGGRHVWLRRRAGLPGLRVWGLLLGGWVLRVGRVCVPGYPGLVSIFVSWFSCEQEPVWGPGVGR